jgi:DNA-binding transcriptional LysR family regulator
MEMHHVTFDLDVLRSFVTGIELGSFAKAADRLGRSTSAISTQLQKLEGQAGTPLLRKAGRGLALTEAGETMLAYARRLLDLNDEAATAVHGLELEGWIRLGMQEDFGESLLPEVLGRFARANPKVRIEARVVRNVELIDRVLSGRLDLALAWSPESPTPYRETVAEVPMCWIGSADGEIGWSASSGDPVPLASFEAPCLIRSAATEALDRAGLAWRQAFVSPSLSGLWAATAAGLGLTVRTPLGLSPRVRPLTSVATGLPELPKLDLVLHRSEAEPSPAVACLTQIVLHSVRQEIARQVGPDKPARRAV